MVAAVGWAAETTCPHFAVEQRLVHFSPKGPDSTCVRVRGTEGSDAHLCHLTAQ